MSKLPIFRSDEKAPRGEFFYVQVGHRFYGGEIAETVEVEVSRRKLRNLDTGPYTYWDNWTRGARATRDRKKKTLAGYLKSTGEKLRDLRELPPVMETQHTGTITPKLVDTIDEAKQFRKKDGALKACERLKGVYDTLDIAVDVRYKGDTR